MVQSDKFTVNLLEAVDGSAVKSNTQVAWLGRRGRGSMDSSRALEYTLNKTAQEIRLISTQQSLRPAFT